MTSPDGQRLGLARLASRAMLMVGGEALQSGFHFALSLALLHVLAAHDYGIFALVMVMGGLALTYVRALTGLPASVAISQSRRRSTAGAHESAFGSGALLLSALLTAIVALLLAFWLDHGALAGAAFIGLWSMRAHLRTAFFARSRQPLVGLSDVVFAASGAGMAALVLTLGGDEVLERIFAAMACANALGIATLLRGAGQPVRISFGARMRARYKALARQLGWSVASVTLTNIQGQSVAFLVAGIAGPAAYAPIAAALVLFVPLRIAAIALANMMHPPLSAMLGRGETRKVWRMATIWAAIMGLVGLVYGAAIVVVLPLLPWEVLRGASVHVIGISAWAIFALTLLYIMPRIILEIQGAFRAIAVLSAVGGAVGAAVVVGILIWADPAWALVGGAVSEAIVLVWSWILIAPMRHGRGVLGAAPR